MGIRRKLNAITDLLRCILRCLEGKHERGPVEVRFMIIVKDDNAPVDFSLSFDVTDAEGNAIPDAQVDVVVESSNPAAVAITMDPANPRKGTASFGAPGLADVSAKISTKSGTLLGAGAQSFTVTTGDPAAISAVTMKFGDLVDQ